MSVMKIESSSIKKWRPRSHEAQASQDLYLACISFLVLLFVAVADTAFRM
jgi:hypothetical protein